MKSKLKFNKADLNNVNKILTDLDIVVKNANQVDIANLNFVTNGNSLNE